MAIPPDTITARCAEAGFALAGVCRASPSDHADAYRAWIDAGRHGSMDYLARNVELRLDPSAFLPGARSIIMVADQYSVRETIPSGAPPSGTGVSPVRNINSGTRVPPVRNLPTTNPDQTKQPPPAPLGRIARYAQGRDYHKVIKKRLHSLCDQLRAEHPGEAFRAFTDTAPILEREHAARAGLGWIGKHTLLINPSLGSWLFLGGIITTLDIAPTAEQPVPDHCGTCTRCIDACPTGAITPHSVDASRCIAYLTIERRDPIEPDFHEQIGDWLFGCDICQEVCPHNSPRPAGADTGAPNPAYTPTRESFNLLEILGWTEEDRINHFSGAALTRATLGMIRRNAAIALRNIESRGGAPL